MDFTQHATMSITPSFFISQSIKLHDLLNAVIRESATAADPDTCIDYLQLTEILSSLLEESQIYSITSASELQQRSTQAHLLISRLQSIEAVISSWEPRTLPMPTRSSSASSRKRSRTPDDNEDHQPASRRRMEVEVEQALNMMPVFEGPFAEMLPATDAMEHDHSSWWTEPYYG